MTDAENALCWLRGWVKPVHVKEEFQQISELVKSVQADTKTNSKLKILKHYHKRNFYVPFLLVAITFFVSTFNGSSTLQTYAVLIFEGLDTPIDKYTATVFLGLTEFIACVVCSFVIHFTGKRKLTFFSVGGTFFCFLFAAIYGYIIKHNKMDTSHYSWLPTTLMISSAFFSHVGIRLIPWVLSGEVFSSQVRKCFYLIIRVCNLFYRESSRCLEINYEFMQIMCYMELIIIIFLQ